MTGYQRTKTLLVFVGLWLHGVHTIALASDLTREYQAIRVNIAINAWQFDPPAVSLPVGQAAALVFHNQDVELHAFVPHRFLEDVPIHLDGNGAPQFNEHGLERVLIPSEGRAEIHFVPPTIGTFWYQCDLPGHQMIGTIVVKEGSPDEPTQSLMR